MEAQTAWGGLLPLYLFLGGLGGATLLFSAMLDAAGPKRYKRTVRPSSWLALLSLVAGVLVLLYDVGVPLRSLLLWRSFGNITSWLSIGAWTLFGAIGLSILLCLTAHLKRGHAWWRMALNVLCCLFGFATCAYTGMLLLSSSAVVTWRSFWIPVLFILSSLSSGITAVELIYRVREKKKRARHLTMWHITAIVLSTLEGVAVTGYCLWLLSSADTTPAFYLLCQGIRAIVFWVMTVFVGIVVPWGCSLACLLIKREPLPLIALSSLCTLLGACALRFAILGIGMRLVVGLI